MISGNHILGLMVLVVMSYNGMMLGAGAATGGRKWNILHSNMGVSAMHMQLLNNDRVVVFDLTDFGPSNISLPNNRCRENPNDLTLQHDCTAHSVEYDVASNSIRPLFVQTNVWCSSGAVMSDGSLMQTGGFNDGQNSVRIFKPCTDSSCDWQEFNNVLKHKRWYATNHILPDGRQVIFGGRDRFSYEFYPKRAGADQAYELPFLSQTRDPSIENNLYPFVFLNVDGNLFIFANNRAILFDYVRRVVVRNYATIPGGDPRNYPSSGSAVLLPLRGGTDADVLVCGGAPKGSFTSANNGNFVEALDTCGRLRITEPNPQWVMETMPMARVMGDMVLLPNGNVLIINGAAAGTAGWGIARNPVLTPLIYRPNNLIGSRFEAQNSSSVPRMYHSTATLLRDGRVLVSGSNPNAYYNFTGVLFPTDLTMQSYSPDYLDSQFARVRPDIVAPASKSRFGYGQLVAVNFTAQDALNTDFVSVTMVAPPFTTHSFSMNQRVLVLDRATGSRADVASLGGQNYEARVLMPSSRILAPPGFYLLFVVFQEIPSPGIWVQISYKARLLSSADHERLSAVLSPYHRRTHLQENLFSDGPNAELSSNFAALRIRFYDLDSRCILSLKSKPQISGGISRIEEQEEPLDPTIGRHCAAEPSRLLLIEHSDIIRRVREEFDLGGKGLVCLGGFRNVRGVYEWNGLKLELDETHYTFGASYEVECESSDPKSARDSIEGLLKSNGVAYQYSEMSKFAIFRTGKLPGS